METRAPKRKLVVELLGFAENKSVMVSAPKKTMKFSAAAEGGAINVHLMLDGRICTFKSRLVKILPQPFDYWHLAYPEEVELHSIRDYSRVLVQLPVSIEYQNVDKARDSVIPNIVLCTDLSMNGVAVEASCSLGDVGEQYFVTFRLAVAGVDQMLLVSCQLRSVKKVEAGVYLHGFEFEDLEDDSKVLIAAYIYQEILMDLGYINE